ncbi:hypothetical protein EDD99_2701 [Streptomyces sp. 846.5]|nr:hypothetical protein [Streptomyces sp. 846.5]TDU04245.1 hypothetical protein EDD99_2701 [Streptomyces sp. 846.5]
MASPASSEPPLYQAPEQPQQIKGVGTSWVNRGPAYWSMRVVLAAGRCLIILIMAIAAAAGLNAATESAPGAWRPVIIIGVALCVAIGFVWGIRTAWQANTSTLSPDEWRGVRRATEAKHPLVLALTRSRLLLLLTLPVSAPVGFGFVLSWLPGVSFGRELPSEHAARLDLEEQRRANAERAEKHAALLHKLHGENE